MTACVNIDVFGLLDPRVGTERRQLALLTDYEQCVEQSDADPANPAGDPVRCEKMLDDIQALTW